jgi:prefoldin subunit 1
MAAPDMELKAAFAELQSKMIDSKQKIKLHDLQIENLKRSGTHALLTDQEISQLPEETKVWWW